MNFTPGTTVRVYCPSKFVYHYGIASTSGYIIDRAPKKGVARRTLLEFSEGQKVEVVPRKIGENPLEVTHKKALSQLGIKYYSALNANCEHFVNWCRKNKYSSNQITIAFFGVIAIIAFVLASLNRSSKK